jgi:hypothetical protein
MSFAASVSGALLAESDRQGVDLLALADRVGCAPHALTEPDGFRPLLVAELQALADVLGVKVSEIMDRASA